jgi:hypothetical protein
MADDSAGSSFGSWPVPIAGKHPLIFLKQADVHWFTQQRLHFLSAMASGSKATKEHVDVAASHRAH